MLLSELTAVVDDYYAAKWSPKRTGMHFGCDCGCGGDNYTVESWDLEEKQAEEAIKKMKKICINLGITYDGID